MPLFSRWSFWTALVCLAAPAAPLFGQASVAVRIEGSPVYVNEAVQLTVQVANFRNCEQPVVPDIPNCTVRALPNQSEFVSAAIRNGRMTEVRSRSYTYELTPLKIGELTIPPITVRVDGETIQTEPKTLQVEPGDAERLFAVEIHVNRERVYVGQRVRATMTIWVKPPPVSALQRGDWQSLLQHIQPLNFGPFPHELANAQDVVRKRRVHGLDEVWYAFDFVADFVADKVGPLEFDQIEVGFLYPARGRYRALRTRPQVEPLEVRSVPQEGRPAAFSGAVGLYDIETTAQPTSVRVGDPVELTIDLFGDGPVDILPPPLLTANAALTANFRVPDETLTGQMHEARRRFTVTIRARSEGVGQIPPIEYPYFDPDHDRFVIARSKPIPLKVAPSAEVAAPDVVLPAGNGGLALQALDGLRDIQSDERLLLATTFPVSPALVTGILAAPPALFLVAWGGVAWARRSAADPTRKRRSRAFRAAAGRIEAAGAGSPPEAGPPAARTAHELSAALAGYLADRFDEPAARFVGAGAVEALRACGAPEELVLRWQALLARCEETAFGGGTSADAESLRAEARACLAAAEGVQR